MSIIFVKFIFLKFYFYIYIFFLTKRFRCAFLAAVFYIILIIFSHDIHYKS